MADLKQDAAPSQLAGVLASSESEICTSGDEETSSNAFCEPRHLDGSGTFEEKEGVRSKHGYLSSLVRDFGCKHVLLQFSMQHVNQGFMCQLCYSTIQYILATYHLSSPVLQMLGAVLDNIWCLKLPLGILSDAWPVMGYNKGPYLLASLLLGILGMLGLGFGFLTDLWPTMLMLGSVQLMFTVADLLSQARFNEKAQECPRGSARLMGFMMGGMLMLGLAGQLALGPIMDKLGPRAPYLFAVVPGVFNLLVVACGCMEETRKSKAECAEDWNRVVSEKAQLAAGIIMTVSIGVMCACGGLPELWMSAGGAGLTALLTMAALATLVHKSFAKICVFFFLSTALNPSISGAALYFYTDGPAKYQDGPHFSVTFYASIVGGLGLLANFVGIVLFEKAAKTMPYRRLLLYANILPPVLSLLDAVMFSRLNIRLGIPDHVFVLGSAACEKALVLWGTMPGYLITAQVAPPNMSGFMCGLINCSTYLGYTVSASCGSFLLQYLGVTPSGEADEGDTFANLWIAALVVATMPLITLVFIPCLIPEGGSYGGIERLDSNNAFEGMMKNLSARRFSGNINKAGDAECAGCLH